MGNKFWFFVYTIFTVALATICTLFIESISNNKRIVAIYDVYKHLKEETEDYEYPKNATFTPNDIEAFFRVSWYQREWNTAEENISDSIVEYLTGEFGDNPIEYLAGLEFDDRYTALMKSTSDIEDIFGIDVTIKFSDVDHLSIIGRSMIDDDGKFVTEISNTLLCNLDEFGFETQVRSVKEYYSTLLHELYHIAQFDSFYGDNKWDFNNTDVSMFRSNYLMYLSDDGGEFGWYTDYLYQPLESTANEFASVTLKKLCCDEQDESEDLTGGEYFESLY